MHPENYNACTLVDANIEAGRSEKIALWFGEERITYGDLHVDICAMSRALRALGIAREDRVLMILNDRPRFPMAFFGAMRIGAVPVPVNPLYKAADYRYFIEDSYARLVITENSCLEKLRQALDGYSEPLSIIFADDLAQEAAESSRPNEYSLRQMLSAHSGELPPVSTHRDDMAFWLYSSGSTGNPKGVVHLHQDIPAVCNTYAKHVLELDEHDIVFGRVLFHAYGLGNSLTFPFNVGASSVLVPGRLGPRGILDAIERYRPTFLFLVPTLYNAILNDPTARSSDLSSIRRCISAAEPLPPDTWRRWQETFGHVILDGIGSTEMLHIFCSNTVEVHKAGSSGKPVPGFELKILDDEDKPVAAGETGHLFVKGASAAAYYWHQRERSRQTMRGEWTATGDRYRMDEEGFYWYEGRADDMLKVGGEWVSPIEIENVLVEHPAINEVAVVGVPVAGVMRIRAVIILAGDTTSNTDPGPELVTELQEWCKSRLQRFQYPHIIDFVNELPKTATGKVQRFKLRMERLDQ